MNREDRHNRLVQWYMDCNGYTRSHLPVDDYIEELNDKSDKEFDEEWECMLEDEEQ